MSRIPEGALSPDGLIENKAVLPQKDFHHPYTPYAIQEEFMHIVYQVLEQGNVGILESPTGTVSIHASTRC